MELFQLVDSRDGAESFLELAFIYNNMGQAGEEKWMGKIFFKCGDGADVVYVLR